MQIRYVGADQDGRAGAVFAEVAARAALEGIRLAGTLRPEIPGVSPRTCETLLRLLPDGPLHDIGMDLGPGATGCRLDAGALEAAVMEVERRLAGAQALVVNKFGKQEAAGRGLVQAIGRACGAGLPVLVGVSPDWRAAFLAFADGAAQPIAADADHVMDWLRAACRPQAA